MNPGATLDLLLKTEHPNRETGVLLNPIMVEVEVTNKNERKLTRIWVNKNKIKNIYKTLNN